LPGSIRSGLKATKTSADGETAGLQRRHEQLAGAADVRRRRQDDCLSRYDLRDDGGAGRPQDGQVRQEVLVDRRRHADDDRAGAAQQPLVAGQLEPLVRERDRQPLAVAVEDVDVAGLDGADPRGVHVHAQDDLAGVVQGQRGRQADITQPDDGDVVGEIGGEDVQIDEVGQARTHVRELTHRVVCLEGH
jgi:hypothetical protein